MVCRWTVAMDTRQGHKIGAKTCLTLAASCVTSVSAEVNGNARQRRRTTLAETHNPSFHTDDATSQF